jgi:hypothetical protein
VILVSALQLARRRAVVGAFVRGGARNHIERKGYASAVTGQEMAKVSPKNTISLACPVHRVEMPWKVWQRAQLTYHTHGVA